MQPCQLRRLTPLPPRGSSVSERRPLQRAKRAQQRATGQLGTNLAALAALPMSSDRNGTRHSQRVSRAVVSQGKSYSVRPSKCRSVRFRACEVRNVQCRKMRNAKCEMSGFAKMRNAPLRNFADGNLRVTRPEATRDVSVRSCDRRACRTRARRCSTTVRVLLVWLARNEDLRDQMRRADLE